MRTLAAVKSLFAFCVRMRYLDVNPAAELELPGYENRLAERIVAEDTTTEANYSRTIAIASARQV